MIILLCVLFVIGASGQNTCQDLGCNQKFKGTCTDVNAPGFPWPIVRTTYDYGAVNETSNSLCKGPPGKEDCCVCLVRREPYVQTCNDKGNRCARKGGRCVDLKNKDWATLNQDVDLTKNIPDLCESETGDPDAQCCKCFRRYKTRPVGYPWEKLWG